MSLAGSPCTSRACSEQVIHLLYRCALIGGATTLVTRCGVICWIKEKKASKACNELLLKALDSKVREMCDPRRADSWSDGHGIHWGSDRSIEDTGDTRVDIGSGAVEGA